MKKISTLHKNWMKDEAYKREYNAIEPEFALASAMTAARSRAGLTQSHLAQRMKTTQSTIARLESGKAMPSGKTLKRFMDATGSQINFVIEQKTHPSISPTTSSVTSQNVTELGVISLTTNEFLSLKPAEKDFLMASSFIMNDIRFYWSLMTRSPIDEPQEDVRAMQTIRWLWCSRKLASVIYEADIALGKIKGKLPLAKEIAKLTPPISKQNNLSPNKKIAATFRNKAAYHYDTEVLSEGLSGFLPEAKHRLFAHPQHGNSISEFGEQVFTLPLLHKINKTKPKDDFDHWLRECSNSILTFCEITTAKILLGALPNKKYQKKLLPMISEAESKNHRWPLFLIA
jgi:transcriptional regulator with XRE-family HTH domain